MSVYLTGVLVQPNGTYGADWKMNGKLFPYLRPNPDAELRLFCFPYAGASAAIYRTWHQKLPPTVEVRAVELPGRGTRLREKPFLGLLPLVEHLGEALEPYLDRPFAFFGHSMGALIAFELARLLRREGRTLPLHLFVSGHRAPHLPSKHRPIHSLPEPEFLQELKNLEGTPEAVLENSELMELLSPVLRADFSVCETYYYHTEEPLSCPITAFGGTDDRDVDRSMLEPWREHTTGEFRLHMLPGNHFFLQTSEEQLLRLVGEVLRQKVLQVV